MSPYRQLQSQEDEQASTLDVYTDNWRQAAFAQYGGLNSARSNGPENAPGPGDRACSSLAAYLIVITTEACACLVVSTSKPLPTDLTITGYAASVGAAQMLAGCADECPHLCAMCST